MDVTGWLSSTVGAEFWEDELGKVQGVGLGSIMGAGLPNLCPVPSNGFGAALGGGL